MECGHSCRRLAAHRGLAFLQDGVRTAARSTARRQHLGLPGGAAGARDSKESGEALNSLGDRKRNAVYSALAVWAEELQVIKESTFPQARHAQVTA